MSSPIVVVGSSNVDMITAVSHFPQAGETILAKSFSIRCGGKGLNQAVAIAKLVSDPSVLSFVSSIGNDHNAQIILETLDRYHMTRDCLVVNSAFSTGLTNICIDQNGENTIVVVPGANAQLIPSQLQYPSFLQHCKIMVLQQEIPLSTVKWLLRCCSERKIVAILNPAPASRDFTVDMEEFAYVNVLIPNETEAKLLTGMNEINPNRAMDILTSKYPDMIIIITCGDKGALVGRRSERREIHCPRIVAKDTVGAGDCFVGTFGYLVYQYLVNNSFESLSMDQLSEIVQKCCNASSFSVQFEGGCDKYPTKIMDLSSFC